MAPFITVGGAKNTGTVTVSGELGIVADHEDNAKIRFNVNFNVEKQLNGSTWIQIDTGTDWLRGQGGTNLYSLRFINLTGDTDDWIAPMAENVWIDLSATREFTMFTPGSGPGANTCDMDFQIRDDISQVTEDTGSYELTSTTSG